MNKDAIKFSNRSSQVHFVYCQSTLWFDQNSSGRKTWKALLVSKYIANHYQLKFYGGNVNCRLLAFLAKRIKYKIWSEQDFYDKTDSWQMLSIYIFPFQDNYFKPLPAVHHVMGN